MISDELKSLICEQLDLPSFEFTEGTKAWEVPGWDSLSHVRILLAVEERYGIRIKGLEAMKLKNVGELQALIEWKLR